MALDGLTESILRTAAQSPPLGYRVKFAFEDGAVILWDGRSTPAVVTNEDAEADTTIRLAAADLEEILAGTLDPTLAYMSGRLKVEGSLGVALKLTATLGA